MTYPPAPWQLHGQLWLSLFRVRDGEHADRPAGVYGAALVAYEPPSPLTYGELLVARPVSGRESAGGGRSPRVRITDIWVDSVDSRDGGRELWAIPKELAELRRETSGGRLRRTRWSTTLDGRPVASATFTDVSSLAPRTPFRTATSQHRGPHEPGPDREVVAPMRGTARSLPCRAAWEFAPDGPLGWLAGKRPLASFRMADFAMSFG